MASRFLLLISVIFLFSCKKDKLEGDKSILIGQWKWVYSIKIEKYHCDDLPYTTILTPVTENNHYTIKFLKKGHVFLFKDGAQQEKYRIVFKDFQFRLNSSYYEYYYYFDINLNNSDKINNLYGNVKSDTLILSGFFPFSSYPNSCVSYTHFFIKE
jgi:hypothetical protein